MANQSGGTLQIPNIPQPKQVNYSDAYSQAAGQIAPKIDEAIGTLTPLPGQIRQDASDIAGTYKSEIPTVQNIYSDLAKNLASQYGQQTDKLNAEKQADVGQAKAAAAKGGFDTTQGYQAAMIGNIQKGYDKQIQSVLDQYGVQSDQLMQEASKSISDLVAEAQQAIMQGDTTAADITTKIVGFKLQEQQMITDAANNIMSANTNAEKAYWAQTYQSAILDIRQQSLDLQAQKVGYYVPGSSFGGGDPAPKKAGGKSSTASGTWSVKTDANGNTYLFNNKTGESKPFDPNTGKAAANNDPLGLGGGSSGQTSGGNLFQTIGQDISGAWNWLQGLGKK